MNSPEALAKSSKPRGVVGWLVQLLAGPELDALRKEVHRRGEEATEALAAGKARESALLERIAALESRPASVRPPDASVDEETLLSPLRLEIEQRVREQADLEKVVAKKEAERRDATSKLAKVVQELEMTTKKLAKLEAAARELEEKFKRVEEKGVDAARQAHVRTQAAAREALEHQAHVGRLEQQLAQLTSERTNSSALEEKLRARESRIEALERELADALGTSRKGVDEAEARASEALIEELRLALASVHAKSA